MDSRVEAELPTQAEAVSNTPSAEALGNESDIPLAVFPPGPPLRMSFVGVGPLQLLPFPVDELPEDWDGTIPPVLTSEYVGTVTVTVIDGGETRPLPFPVDELLADDWSSQ